MNIYIYIFIYLVENNRENKNYDLVLASISKTI